MIEMKVFASGKNPDQIKQVGGAPADREEPVGGAPADREEPVGGAPADREEPVGGAAVGTTASPSSLAQERTKDPRKLMRIWGKSRDYQSVSNLEEPKSAFIAQSGSKSYLALSAFPDRLGAANQLQTQRYDRTHRSYSRLIKRFLAGQMYALLGGLGVGSFYVHKQHLAMLNPLNEHTKTNPITIALMGAINHAHKPEDRITETLHLLSRSLVQSVVPSKELDACYVDAEDQELKTFLACLQAGQVPEYALFHGKRLPIFGLMEVLAASRLLADVDVLGPKAEHIGFVLESKDGQPIALRVLKQGASKAFSWWDDHNQFMHSFNSIYRGNKLGDKKDIQFARFNREVIKWDKLSASQRLRFLTALKLGYETLKDEGLLDFMIRRDGVWSSVLHSEAPLLTPEIIENLKTQCQAYSEGQLLPEVYGPLLTLDSLAGLQIEVNKDSAPIEQAPFTPKLFKAASITLEDAKAEALADREAHLLRAPEV